MRHFSLLALILLAAACAPHGAPSNPSEALVGRWGDVGNCAQALQFNADSTFVYAGRTGAWTLQGNRLTLSGPAGVAPAEIQWIDRDHMKLTRPDGTMGVSQRCPA